MNYYAKLIKLTLLSTISIFMFSCSDDETDVLPQNNSITSIASSVSEFSILTDALIRTGLDQTLDQSGAFTVFAPTNDAFTTFLTNNNIASLDDVSNEALTQILLNHVLDGVNKSTDLTTTYVSTLALGNASDTNKLSMFINTSNGVVLNGVSTVLQADILASNGVIHKVNAVIGLPTIVTHATANSSFSTLVSVLTDPNQPDFAGILSGNTGGPFTVFAPTNDAFTDLNTELAPGGIASVSNANLTKVLQYHVVGEANVLSSQLTNNMNVNTLVDQEFTINLMNNTATITDSADRESEIIATDVQCSNGVIHVINKVLLPSFN
jgi:uncharacterized surface protein with fasciclin (FAS1) repeats